MDVTAKNKGRKRKHPFMLEDPVKDLKADKVPLKLAISKVSIADWTALLEDSWGAIKETRFFYA